MLENTKINSSAIASNGDNGGGSLNVFYPYYILLFSRIWWPLLVIASNMPLGFASLDI